MKLVLIRHAKSSWEHNVSDRDRPLKNRGFKDANLVSKELKSRFEKPYSIYSSPANRAFTTCQIFCENLSVSQDEISVQEALYDFSGNNVLNFLKELSDEEEFVMIFGHNHAFTSLANLLGDDYIDNLPTSGVVSILFKENSWSDISQGKTDFILTPKMLKG